jgi:tripartite-type tricarboxylate transporter receptor subunit TctC
MPKAIVQKLNTAIAAFIRSPPMRDRLVREGAQIAAGAPEECARFRSAEVPKISAILQHAGVKRGTF